MKYYSKCPKCKQYFLLHKCLEEAKEQLEIHEKALHKGKPCGIFGIDYGKTT